MNKHKTNTENTRFLSYFPILLNPNKQDLLSSHQRVCHKKKKKKNGGLVFFYCLTPFVSWFLLDNAVCSRALASIHGPEIFREFLVAMFMVLHLIKKKPLGAFYCE